LTARRLLVVALMCGKLALGSAMPLPMLTSPPPHCASQHDSTTDTSMPPMSMPGMSMPTGSHPAAPCCKSGACALLQAPALALVTPTLALRLRIAARSCPPQLQAVAAPVSAPFRPPI
jgi:hypothetical protein